MVQIFPCPRFGPCNSVSLTPSAPFPQTSPVMTSLGEIGKKGMVHGILWWFMGFSMRSYWILWWSYGILWWSCGFWWKFMGLYGDHMGFYGDHIGFHGAYRNSWWILFGFYADMSWGIDQKYWDIINIFIGYNDEVIKHGPDLIILIENLEI